MHGKRSYAVLLSLLISSGLNASACFLDTDCVSLDPQCDTIGLITYALTDTTPRFVAVGNAGTVVYSTDARNWKVASAGAAGLNDVTYGASGFVAVGASGAIQQSPNAAEGTWVQRTSGTALEIQSITYGNGRYVAVGGTGGVADVILVSPTGETWQVLSLGLGQKLWGVEYFPVLGQFVATGDSSNVRVSADGLTWSNLSIGGGVNLRGDLAYGNGRFLIGDDASIVYAGLTPGALAATGSISAAASQGVVFFNGSFHLAGDTGALFRTADGVGAAALTSNALGSVRWGMMASETQAVSVGWTGEILYTTDGQNWQGPVVPVASDLFGCVFARIPARLAQ